MDYNLKGTGLSLSLEMREYLDRKVTHIEKFLHNGTASPLDVELSYDSAAPAAKYHVSLKSILSKRALYARAEGITLHEAIDLAVEEFTREVVRVKEKRQHIMRHSAARVKDFLRGLRNRF